MGSRDIPLAGLLARVRRIARAAQASADRSRQGAMIEVPSALQAASNEIATPSSWRPSLARLSVEFDGRLVHGDRAVPHVRLGLPRFAWLTRRRSQRIRVWCHAEDGWHPHLTIDGHAVTTAGNRFPA